MEIVFLLVGIAVGGLLIYLFIKNKISQPNSQTLSKLSELEREKSVLIDRSEQTSVQLKNLERILRDHHD